MGNAYDRVDQELSELESAAVIAAEPVYREAIAREIEVRSDAFDMWSRFAVITARALLLGELLGMADTYADAGVEVVPDGEPVAESRGMDAYADPDDLGRSTGGFIVKPFLAAVDAFNVRVPRLASTVRTLTRNAIRLAAAITTMEAADGAKEILKRSALRAATDGSFFVTGVDLETTKRLRKLVADAVRGTTPEQKSLPEFIRKAQLQGAGNLTSARLEVVYRNNVSSAHAEGQVQTLRREEIRSVAPLVMLHEIIDGRTRHTHRQINGYVNTIEAIERQGLRFPNGHNCRGRLRPVSRVKAERLGLLDAGGNPSEGAIALHNGAKQGMIDSGVYPDPGFS